MDKLNGQSMDLENKNIEELKKLFPNAVTEGRIDFEKLKLILGEEIDDSIEKYQLTWNGKSKAIKLAQIPSTATLRPSKEDSVDWNTTGNLYIEGDNLEVLKQLQKTYFGKIKMIYIDPPYNTGGDFVYKDDFKDSLKNYKDQTNQSKSSNAETSGRYHTDWLNMMYPRLMLAKNLLSDDGVIFISIDSNEISNLIKIMDELFSEFNRLGVMPRKTKSTTSASKTGINEQHEFYLIYSRLKNDFILNGGEKNFDIYKNPDNDPKGEWKSADPTAPRTNDQYKIKNPYTGKVDTPPIGRSWAFPESRLSELVHQGKVVFKREHKENERGFIYKYYKNEIRNKVSYFDSLSAIDNKYFNSVGTKELINIFNIKIFDAPKPVSFLRHLIESNDNNNHYVLDFFSGSATTAHAVMKLNAEDGGNRKFIMVQLPEKTDEKSEAYKAGYKNICEIGKERIRRAGQQIKQELIDKKNKVGMLDENIVNPESLDIGFKVFKLDETNIKAWDSSAEVTKESLLDQVEVIKENRSTEDVLYEILLKYGVFNHTVKEITINDKTMYDIADGYMIVNLNDKIEDADIKEITKRSPHVVIFLESGFVNDNDKINAEATLKHNGVEDVKCI